MVSDEPRKNSVYGVGIPDDLRSMVVTQVLARAGRSCQVCKLEETQERGAYVLHIHHIDGDPTNNRFNNLKLLCQRCHNQAHQMLGPGSATLHPDPKEKEIAVKRQATRRSQKIENVTDRLIRFRIEKIKPKPVQMCCKYLYIIDGRVSEAVSEAYPSDTRTTPRGPVGTDVKMDVWYPPEYTSQEAAFKAQNDDGVKRVHPAAVFSVSTAKRRGRLRTCAVPLDPKMEPWAMEMMKYFEDKGDEYVFPMTRQRVHSRARNVWADLVYVIEDYSVVINKEASGIQRIDTQTTEERRRTKRVDRHKRRWTLHALRHLRASDLVDYYGFLGAHLSSFGGWTTATAMGVSPSVGRYLDLQWRSYFQKLLRRRY